jgi:hypothetical protein
MEKQEFIDLVKQYSNDTACLSFTKRDHPAFISLMKADKEIIPIALGRLQERANCKFDIDNSPL